MTASLHITASGEKFGWECDECEYGGGGDWSFWETAETVILGHRRRNHGGIGIIDGYDLRPTRTTK